MESSAFDRLWDFLTSTELFLGVLWAGLAALSVTLLVLMWTRWGQSRPLRKCLFLSLVAHVLLFGYSTTVQVFLPAAESPGEPAIRVSLAEEDPEREASSIEASPDAEKPWETLLHDSVAQPDLDEPSKVETPELPEPQRKPAPAEAGTARAGRLGPPAVGRRRRAGSPIAGGRSPETADGFEPVGRTDRGPGGPGSRRGPGPRAGPAAARPGRRAEPTEPAGARGSPRPAVRALGASRPSAENGAGRKDRGRRRLDGGSGRRALVDPARHARRTDRPAGRQCRRPRRRAARAAPPAVAGVPGRQESRRW